MGSMGSTFVALRYAIVPDGDAWVLPEGKVPESIPHERAAERLKSVLVEWAKSLDRPVTIARNFAIRFWRDAPRVGIDPDVCVLDPPPPGVDQAGSLMLWREGRCPPSVSFEIVSENHPHKDYRDVHERYAAMGAPELCVFDPLLAGPAALGGPVAIQLWRRDETGTFERVYAGEGPVHCQALSAFLRVRGQHLIVSDDPQGLREWLPAAERADQERERADQERERADQERERADQERERADQEREEKERERSERLKAEERLAVLERRLAAGESES